MCFLLKNSASPGWIAFSMDEEDQAKGWGHLAIKGNSWDLWLRLLLQNLSFCCFHYAGFGLKSFYNK